MILFNLVILPVLSPHLPANTPCFITVCLPDCLSACLFGWAFNHRLYAVWHPSEGEKADWIKALKHLWLHRQLLVCVQIHQHRRVKVLFLSGTTVSSFFLFSFYKCMIWLNWAVNMWDLLVHDIWFQYWCVYHILVQHRAKHVRKSLPGVYPQYKNNDNISNVFTQAIGWNLRCGLLIILLNFDIIDVSHKSIYFSLIVGLL